MTAIVEVVSGRKPAPAETEIHELIRERWSPHAFLEAPVPVPLLRSLVEAARWAASSMNEQPWRLIIAERDRDPDGHARILATLVAANAVWARRAPVFMIVAARGNFTRNGAPNRWASYDTGLAIGQLVLQATALGLRVHQMGGFDAEAARESLGIPEDCDPIAVLAIGYPGDPRELDEKLQARESAPRQRRPVNEWVHAGGWGKPWAT